MIEFKTPSEKDVGLMKNFASSIDGCLAHLANEEIKHVSHVVASKLQEALMWFSHGVLNMPALAPEAPAGEPAKPVEGELVN